MSWVAVGRRDLNVRGVGRRLSRGRQIGVTFIVGSADMRSL